MESAIMAALDQVVTVPSLITAVLAGVTVDFHKGLAKRVQPGKSPIRLLLRLPESEFGRRTMRLIPMFWCFVFFQLPGLHPVTSTGENEQVGMVLGLSAFWGILASYVYGAVLGVAKKRLPVPAAAPDRWQTAKIPIPSRNDRKDKVEPS